MIMMYLCSWIVMDSNVTMDTVYPWSGTVMVLRTALMAQMNNPVVSY